MEKIFSLFVILFTVFLTSGCDKKEENNQNKKGNQFFEENQSLEIKKQVQEKNFYPDLVSSELNKDSWETYVDGNWNFSIKIPENLFYKANLYGEKYPGEECEACGNGGHLLTISDNEKNLENPEMIKGENIHVVISTSELNPEDVLETRNDNFSYTDVLLGGKECLFTTDQEKNSVSYRLMKDGYLYTIFSEIPDVENKEEIYNLINNIVLTLNFIERI